MPRNLRPAPTVIRHTIVIVSWDDAWIDTEDFTIKKAKKMKGVLRHTVGWLVDENEEGIVLCTDYYEKKSDGFNTPMFIPWGWVRDYTEVEI
jgi:hypothetical protein